jgi:hypothetical protein
MTTPEEVHRATVFLSDNTQIDVVGGYFYAQDSDAVSGACKWFCEAQYDDGVNIHFMNYSNISTVLAYNQSEFTNACRGIKPGKHPSIPA